MLIEAPARTAQLVVDTYHEYAALLPTLQLPNINTALSMITHNSQYELKLSK